MPKSKSDPELIQELLAEVGVLKGEVEQLRAENIALRAKVNELEEKLSTNSRNS